jgi:hypothetical protein
VYLSDKDIWQTDVGGYGINSWLISQALVNNASICRVAVGERKHKSLPGKMELRLKQVTKTAFEQIIRNFHWWQNKGKIARPLPAFGLEYKGYPRDTEIDYHRLISNYRHGFNRYASLYERLLPADIFEQLESRVSLADRFKGNVEEFNFPARLWAQIVYEYLFAFKFRKEFAHADLLNSFLALYEGRAAGYLKEIDSKKKILSGQSLSPQDKGELLGLEVERLLMVQLSEFEQLRENFLRRWQRRQSPLVAAPERFVITELLVPGVSLILPENISNHGTQLQTMQIKDELLQEYKGRFDSFIYRRLGVSKKATPSQIAAGVRNFMRQLEEKIDSWLLPGNLYTISDTREIVERIFEYLPRNKTYCLRSETVERFLRKNLPRNLMAKFNCKDLDSLFKIYDPKDVLALAWWLEDRDYTENIWKWITEVVTPDDFTEEFIKPLVVDYEDFPALAQLKETSGLDRLAGRVVVCNLPKARGGEFPKLRYLTTISKNIVEAERFGQVWRQFAKEGNGFGQKVTNSIRGHWGRRPLSAHMMFENGHQRVLVGRFQMMAQRIRKEAGEKKDREAWLLARYLEDMAFSYPLAMKMPDGSFIPCSAWTWASFSFKGGKGTPTPFSLHVERDWASREFLERLLVASGLGDSDTIDQEVIHLMSQGRESEDLARVVLGLPEEREKGIQQKDISPALRQAPRISTSKKTRVLMTTPGSLARTKLRR